MTNVERTDEVSPSQRQPRRPRGSGQRPLKPGRREQGRPSSPRGGNEGRPSEDRRSSGSMGDRSPGEGKSGGQGAAGRSPGKGRPGRGAMNRSSTGGRSGGSAGDRSPSFRGRRTESGDEGPSERRAFPGKEASAQRKSWSQNGKPRARDGQHRTTSASDSRPKTPGRFSGVDESPSGERTRRPPARDGATGHTGPVLPAEITGYELDPEIRTELSSLGRDRGKVVARHLVMVGLLLDEDPDTAWEHAQAAKRLGPRIAPVREATGLAAYRTGRYQEALAELRTTRRITGSPVHLPVMADCERGLGRPERALALAESPEARDLDAAGRVELLIVAAGARADLGQLDAAVLTLQVPQLRARTKEPWLARLRSAYGDALSAVGRVEEARHWLGEAAAVDPDGVTGVAERILGDDVVFLDDGAEVEDLETPDDAEAIVPRTPGPREGDPG
jgi:hypothetical protein